MTAVTPIKSHRVEQWTERLVEYINAYDPTDFKYGERDCCTFVAGAVQAVTGIDHM